MFDLGEDGLSTHKVASLSHDDIVYTACESLRWPLLLCFPCFWSSRHVSVISRTAEKTLIGSLVYIAVIPTSESSTLHLLVVTQTGVRLYFTTTPDGVTSRPSLLALVHVRLPPGYSPSSNCDHPGNTVQRAFYRKGTWHHHLSSSSSLWMHILSLFLFWFPNSLVLSTCTDVTHRCAVCTLHILCHLQYIHLFTITIVPFSFAYKKYSCIGLVHLSLRLFAALIKSPWWPRHNMAVRSWPFPIPNFTGWVSCWISITRLVVKQP